MLQSSSVKLSWRQYLSAGVGDLLVKLLQAVLLGSPPPPLASPAQAMLRSLTRGSAFDGHSGKGLPLPVMPLDATAILAWFTQDVLPRPTSKLAKPSGAAAAAAADEKVLLLLARLTRTMLAGGGAAIGEGPAALDAAGADASGQRVAAVLTPLLAWSAGLVRSALSKLLDEPDSQAAYTPLLMSPQAGGAAKPAPPADKLPTAGVVRAASKLAATAMHGLLQAGVAASAPGARGQLAEVLGMLLDMAEAYVSVCMPAAADAPGAPAPASSDKVRALACSLVRTPSYGTLPVFGKGKAAHR